MLSRLFKITATTSLAFLLLLLLSHLLYLGRIYPGVQIAGTPLEGKTRRETLKLFEAADYPTKATLAGGEKTFELPAKTISLAYNKEETAAAALSIGKKKNLPRNYTEIWKALTIGINLPFVLSYDEDSLNKFLDELEDELNIPAIPPKISIANGKVAIEKGKAGRTVDRAALSDSIVSAFSYLKREPLIIPINDTQILTKEGVAELEKRAEKFINAKATFTQSENTITFKDSELVAFLEPGKRFSDEEIEKAVLKIAEAVNRPVQNATFQIEPSDEAGHVGKVVEFKPAKDGITVEKDKLKDAFRQALILIENGQKESNAEVPIKTTSPVITTASVNNLGIKELIGTGKSQFKNSAATRMHNISLAASRLNGMVIPPGETLSFNEALGDVSFFTGYQQAYVIKEGKIILGDGGGVCQVSTTLFRAALSSGLPIVERRAHSYRVSYYEQDSSPGIDATVYSPSPDLKIKNDTPAHILIQSYFDKKNSALTFEFYGTSDGRVATITKPKLWDFTPPPPDLYQDDPTLPQGTVKQINSKASGAKAAFDYKVVKGAEVLQNRTFLSVYRPWQGLYMRGTGQ